MSRTAAGVYTLPSNSWNPAVDGTVIDETAWNTTASDIETAIDDSIADNLQATIDPTAITVTADADTSIFTLDNSNAITIPTGTAAIVSGLRINTPNLTATGTITASASLYIQGAATEGTTDYSIWVDAGNARFDGFVITPDTGELTIATGVVTATGAYHTIDTESDAASDDLDTISGGVDGAMLIIQAEDGARTVTAKDATGNLQLAGDFALDNRQDTLQLIYSGANAAWCEISRSSNGA